MREVHCGEETLGDGFWTVFPKFKLEPEPFSTKVYVKKIHTSKKNIEFQCNMKQILANTNNASTGHKLQGMSKDIIIVTS
jgi:hypothetical protein